MLVNKIACVADKTDSSRKLLKLLIAKYGVIDIDNEQNISSIDVIVVIGGDGFMLHSLHRFINFHLPFYGINRGTVGFLLNSFETDDNLIEKITNGECNNFDCYKMKS